MDERRNHYRVLGVQPDASAYVIRAAYRAAMQKMRVHPDLGGDHSIAAALNQAYGVLRHPGQRKRYDQKLLALWNKAELAGHRLHGSTPPKHSDSGNRRNYYRLLGVQPDAPDAIIVAAYQARCGATGIDHGLIDEAFATLSNSAERQKYDDWLQGGATSSDDALIVTSHCAFCRASHCEYPGVHQVLRCYSCGSPLQSASATSARDFARLELNAPIQVCQAFPYRIDHAVVADLAPGGLAIHSARPLDIDMVLRLTATGFDAVARVVHRMADDTGWCHGVQFLTVDYADAVFVDTAC